VILLFKFDDREGGGGQEAKLGIIAAVKIMTQHLRNVTKQYLSERTF
jgi:hypothetical protein